MKNKTLLAAYNDYLIHNSITLLLEDIRANCEHKQAACAGNFDCFYNDSETIYLSFDGVVSCHCKEIDSKPESNCYASTEISRIQNHNKALQAEGYKARIQIKFDGEKTRHLGVSWKELEQIKQILCKGE